MLNPVEREIVKCNCVLFFAQQFAQLVREVVEEGWQVTDPHGLSRSLQSLHEVSKGHYYTTYRPMHDPHPASVV